MRLPTLFPRRACIGYLALAIASLLVPSVVDAQSWKGTLDSVYKGREGTLRVSVPRVKHNLISRNSKIIHVSEEGVYYQTGTVKTHTIEDMQDHFTNFLGGRTAEVQVLPAGTVVYIKKLHYVGDEIRVEFETEPFGADVIIDMGKDYKKWLASDAIPKFETLLKEAFSFGPITELAEQHPEWTPDLIAKLDAKTLEIGMKPDMLLYAFGEPVNKRRRLTAEGQKEEWEYVGRDAMTVSFVDGMVTEVLFEE